MQISKVKIESIKINDRFRKDMGNLDELALSIQSKGLIQPITIDTEHNLLAGGRRLTACQIVGLSTVPCIIRETEDELDAKEIELFENIHRKDMEWHEQAELTSRIHALMQEKHADKYGKLSWKNNDTAKLLGKSESAVRLDVEMSKMVEVLPDLKNEKKASDARRKYNRLIENQIVQEALTEAKSKGKAQRITFANSHYMIGDSLPAMLAQGKHVSEGTRAGAHFAEVDPPYAIALDEMNANKNKLGLDEYHEIPSSDYPEFMKYTTALVYKCLAKDAFCVWWHGPSWHELVRTSLLNAGFKLDPIPGIWYKSNTGAASMAPNTHLARNYEPFFIARKGTPQLRKPGRSNVFDFQGVSPTARIHATERPVTLIREILTTFTGPKHTIICPFLGSGNTIIAAYHEGMNCYGWDLSEEMKSHFLTRVQKEFPDDFTPEFKG
jgi:ParB/RepB/Spo0J family partition protein